MKIKAEIEKTGYQINDNYLTLEQCKHFLKLIDDYRKNHKVPNVYRQSRERSLDYFVIDGVQIKQHLPEVWQIYHNVNNIVNELSGQKLVPLANQRVGVNINIMSSGGEYRWHYDRNFVTVLLYLNEVKKGGELEMCPNYRLYINQQKYTFIQKYFDYLFQLKIIRNLFGNQINVKPSSGRILIMLGDRCLHSVQALEGNDERINIVMSYDIPGKNFPIEKQLDSYLYTQEEKYSSDPNYL
ncbi:2OG-Fe(II) oxygenase [Crocosphaera sp.]|uniref:2OG-Fe(II) oxygenase n=1 Tax=Crocosphaera sp. TaxID=2729996 RepID=UPI0026279289|nr:2OG-Fe(II) oxygenase [Crocosphaera sp.]MDJ0579687.1 2OG-Fe(II) oxygenase [Crocosphaera sp.]